MFVIKKQREKVAVEDGEKDIVVEVVAWLPFSLSSEK